jgi:hypothetical protein
MDEGKRRRSRKLKLLPTLAIKTSARFTGDLSFDEKYFEINA